MCLCVRVRDPPRAKSRLDESEFPDKSVLPRHCMKNSIADTGARRLNEAGATRAVAEAVIVITADNHIGSRGPEARSPCLRRRFSVCCGFAHSSIAESVAELRVGADKNPNPNKQNKVKIKFVPSSLRAPERCSFSRRKSEI